MKPLKLGLVFVLMLIMMSAIAHPPKKIALKFDMKSQELDVKIDHEVRDMNVHFIKNITVRVNGTKVLSQVYKKQKDLLADVYRFKLENIKVGDLVKVTATSNGWGKKRKKILIH